MKQLEEMRSRMLADHADILTQTYPAFSDPELESREARLLELAEGWGLDAILVVEAARAGSATGWITGWPVTAEAVTVLGRDLPRTMYVQHFNHLPLARRIAWRTAVEWGWKSGVAEAADLMKRGGVRNVGLIGRLPMGQLEALAAMFELTDLNGDYTRLRLVKSAEE